ncbi:MAG TPA: phospholipase D-like domain-containing protein, partial [Caulobacteraceae bacterium]|nr:phospholipase D-like domain-containing protein [Caulobacteraceae bacterium]
PEARDEPDLGALLIGLADENPDLDVRVLIWRSALAICATQDFFPHRARGRFAGTRVKFRLDDTVPFGACHHQKIIVVDDQVAFCGSADIAADRWDTPAHLDRDARRRLPGGLGRPPRHEVMALVEGSIAQRLGEIARERWRLSEDPRPVAAPPWPGNRDLWPEDLKPDLTDVPCGAALTSPGWRGRPCAHEVAALTARAIAEARERIYLENQYFASPIVAEALARRLAESDGPQIVLVSTEHSVSYFDRLTMDRARSAQIWRLQAADVFGRFRAYAPATVGGQAIIVHAKVMIVDDRLARIGSANINNRSGGFDSECDLALEPGDEAGREAVTRLMDRLAGHWVARPAADFARARALHGGLIGALDSYGPGRLRPLARHRLGPLGELIATFHIGDPMGPEDSWQALRRRERLYSQVRAQAAQTGA